jgi:citrate lyase subunit beta/citryl-CoA lyase
VATTLRPRRSVLYVPGSNSRAIDKAQELAVDAVILDLEDAVAPDQKLAARTQVEAVLEGAEFGHREVVVRVNAMDTPWGKSDLAAVASLPISAVLIPKLESERQLEACRGALHMGGAKDNLPFWIMAETPLGVLNLRTIMESDQPIAAIVMGTADLAKNMGIPRGSERAGLRSTLEHCVLVARAYGISALDGVETDFNNAEAFETACLEGKQMGFDGKTLIHPNQVDTANKVFGVTTQQIAQAIKIVEAWQDAPEDTGVMVVDGDMVEALHYEQALKTLADNREIGKRRKDEE